MFKSIKEEPIIACGMTAQELVETLSNNKAKSARRALNFFDGEQESEMIAVLNDPNRGRANWKSKGLTPRFRNLTRMVVEKSGMLFKDTLPVLEIFDKNTNEENDPATQLLAEKLSEVEFIEFMNNFDQVLRLLRTAMIMVQWDVENQNWMFDILHRGNAEVIIDPATRKPMCLIFRSHENCYWVWTPEEITELVVIGEGSNQKVEVASRNPNTYGIIPIAVFYDTNTPRTGFWVEAENSLISLNEMVNLHITDSEFSILWSKMSTAVTNLRPAGGPENIETIEYAAGPGDVLPRRQQGTSGMLGGPNQVVVMDSQGVDNPFFEYKAPVIDLLPLNQVMDAWTKSFAADWSVIIRAQGEGRAESGFQLVVESMPNLDLRKQRQRMFESGFKRLYRVLSAVYNTATGTNEMPVDANLYATFSAPVLPIDMQIEETVWSLRIKEGRATPVDYFQHVWGMNKEEAELKYQEIQDFNAEHAAGVVLPPDVENEIIGGKPQDTNTESQPSIDPQMGNKRMAAAKV